MGGFSAGLASLSEHGRTERLGYRHLKAKVAAGLDPGALATAERPRTVADLAKLFCRESIEKRRKRPGEAKRVIDQHIVPHLGRLPLAAVDTLSCRRPIQKLVEKGHPRAAAVALALLKQLLGFGWEIGALDRNPAAPLKPSTFGIVKTERKRFLTPEEIPPVLMAIGQADMEPETRLGLLLLFFTGLRTAEALTLEWTDVDFEAKTLSVRPENQKLTKAQAKNAEPYVVPLSPIVVGILRELQGLAPEDEPAAKRWVFYSPASDIGRLADKSLVRAMTRLWIPERLNPKPLIVGIPQARPHDFRRTLATHLSGTLGFPPHVAQLCLGHSLGHLLGSAVAGVYDKAKRLEERRRALEAYAEWVEGVVSGIVARVVPLEARRARA